LFLSFGKSLVRFSLSLDLNWFHFSFWWSRSYFIIFVKVNICFSLYLSQFLLSYRSSHKRSSFQVVQLFLRKIRIRFRWDFVDLCLLILFQLL
jgi:hypothetical protein